jgi:hypothetical protein
VKLYYILYFVLFNFCFLGSDFAAASGSTSTALAGSGRAAIDSTESFILNPATLAHFDGASLTLSTYFYQNPVLKNDSKAWRLSIAENSPLNELPLAMSYAKTSDSSSQQNDFWFSGGNFLSPFISVGFNYHYSEWRKQDNKTSAPTTGFTTPLSQSNLIFENNASLGILVTPNPYLGFSFVAQDFIKQTDKLSVAHSVDGITTNSTAPINAPELSIGGVFLYDSFLRLHANIMTDESPIYRHHGQISLGLENMINEWVLTRWGIAHSRLAYADSTELSQNSFAFGMGFIGPRFEVYLATKQNTGFQGTREHSVDFHIPF